MNAEAEMTHSPSGRMMARSFRQKEKAVSSMRRTVEGRDNSARETQAEKAEV